MVGHNGGGAPLDKQSLALEYRKGLRGTSGKCVRAAETSTGWMPSSTATAGFSRRATWAAVVSRLAIGSVCIEMMRGGGRSEKLDVRLVGNLPETTALTWRWAGSQ